MLLALAAPLPAVDMLYVTMNNNTIVSYDTTGNNGSTIAASVATFASTNLSSPNGLAFDSSGNLYAANYGNNTISKFNASGGYVSNITTNVNGPTDLAFDSSGNLYAANYGSSSTISKFNSAGTFLSRINSNLSGPVGLAFDSTGNLYASNSGDNTISKFNSAGTYLSQINSNLNFPYGLAFDSSGNLYASNIADNTISKFNSSGTFLTSWGTGAAPGYLAFKPVSVPEPSTYALATIATGVMAYLARRRKARTA